MEMQQRKDLETKVSEIREKYTRHLKEWPEMKAIDTLIEYIQALEDDLKDFKSTWE